MNHIGHYNSRKKEKSYPSTLVLVLIAVLPYHVFVVSGSSEIDATTVVSRVIDGNTFVTTMEEKN